MCPNCDLGSLTPAVFEEFFERARTEGLSTLVCAQCGTVVSTELLLLTSSVPEHSLQDVEY